MDSLFDFIQSSPLAIWGLFALLILCGLGLPLPEDVVLISAGAFAAHTNGSWITISMLMLLGVLGGDSLTFTVGRRYGSRMLASPRARRWFSEEKQTRVSMLLAKHGPWAFFAARFMPGIRSLCFFFGGAMRARFTRFLAFNGLAAVLSVPFFVWLGHFLWLRFGSDIQAFREAIAQTQSYTLIFGSVVILTVLVLIWKNRSRLKQFFQPR